MTSVVPPAANGTIIVMGRDEDKSPANNERQPMAGAQPVP